MLPQAYRLRAREDFERVFRSAKPFTIDEIRVLSIPNKGAQTRIGVAFQGKAFSKASAKHFYKRKILEAIRLHKEELPQGIDVVVLFKDKFSQPHFSVFQEKVTSLIKKLHSLKY